VNEVTLCPLSLSSSAHHILPVHQPSEEEEEAPPHAPPRDRQDRVHSQDRVAPPHAQAAFLSEEEFTALLRSVKLEACLAPLIAFGEIRVRVVRRVLR